MGDGALHDIFAENIYAGTHVHQRIDAFGIKLVQFVDEADHLLEVVFETFFVCVSDLQPRKFGEIVNHFGGDGHVNKSIGNERRDL